MLKTSPTNIITEFLLNPVDIITGELAFGNLQQLQ